MPLKRYYITVNKMIYFEKLVACKKKYTLYVPTDLITL